MPPISTNRNFFFAAFDLCFFLRVNFFFKKYHIQGGTGIFSFAFSLPEKKTRKNY
jgi:hypothetical protein